MSMTTSMILALALLVLDVTMPGRATALQPRRTGQESFLTRAVFADGRLWVLSDAGDLSSITEGSQVQAEESLPEPALDLCLSDGFPEVITCKRDDCTNWVLRRRVHGKWSIEATVQSEHEDFVVMSCAAKEATLLTTSRLIDAGSSKQSAVVLSENVQAGLVTSVLATTDHVFVGLNRGEWGGGLQRIDRRTGQVISIERNETWDLCSGPLNTACDPVNGIATEPWRPDCVAAAVGLVHFEPSGRIVEVYGDEVQRLYEKPYRARVAKVCRAACLQAGKSIRWVADQARACGPSTYPTRVRARTPERRG